MNREPVSRELFDEVMVPNYAPGNIIPVRGEGSEPSALVARACYNHRVLRPGTH